MNGHEIATFFVVGVFLFPVLAIVGFAGAFVYGVVAGMRTPKKD